MYIYICTYIHTYIHTCTYIYIYIYICTCNVMQCNAMYVDSHPSHSLLLNARIWWMWRSRTAAVKLDPLQADFRGCYPQEGVVGENKTAVVKALSGIPIHHEHIYIYYTRLCMYI